MYWVFANIILGLICAIFFILEHKTYDYQDPLKYEIGNMEQVADKMYLKHDYLDLKLKLGIN